MADKVERVLDSMVDRVLIYRLADRRKGRKPRTEAKNRKAKTRVKVKVISPHGEPACDKIESV